VVAALLLATAGKAVNDNHATAAKTKVLII
jgi:hypothetical protein